MRCLQRRSAGRLAVAGMIGLALTATSGLHAQTGLSGRLITDGELWSTDSGSRLLTRDDGHPAPLFRVQLFAAAQLGDHWSFHSLTELETGKATSDGKTHVDFDQVELRYVDSPALIVGVGRFIHPVGAFGARRFSTVNPLIGEPDAYPEAYPWGARVEGDLANFDYRVAAVTLPVSHPGYVPDPGARLRPAVGAGYSLGPALHLGVSATIGSYLHSSLQDSVPAGKRWSDYAQRILAFDARFSSGYFESHAELALSGYDVPTRSNPVNGLSYFLEGKYTWSPRFFTALRLEENRYAFVRAAGIGVWFARDVQMLNGEVAAGYRFSPALLVKISYRRDRWPPDLAAVLPNGHGLAIQLSYQAALQP